MMDQAAQVIGFFSWSYSMKIENYPCIDPIRRLIISFKFLTISVEITLLLKIYFLTKFKRYEIYLIWEKSKGNFSKRFSSFVFFRENNFLEFKLIDFNNHVIIRIIATNERVENNTLFESNLFFFLSLS